MSGDVTITNAGATTVGKIGGTTVSGVGLANNNLLQNTSGGAIAGNSVLVSTGTGTGVTALSSPASGVLTSSGGVPSWSTISSDTFTQYALLAGRSGGQTLYGGTAASNSITLDSTSNATKGSIILAPNGGNVGIGTTSPGARLEIYGPSSTLTSNSGMIQVYSTDNQAQDTGGSISLGGKDGTVSSRNFATVAGYKENSTSGNYSGYLAFGTRPNGSSIAERMRITSSGNVGIGTTNPTVPLNVVASGAGSQGAIFIDTYDTNNTYGTMLMLRNARGTASVPSNTLNGDWIGSIGARGYGTTGFSSLSKAGVNFYAEEDWTDSAQGTAIGFLTTTPGTTSRTEKLTVKGSGNIGIGTTNPQELLSVGYGANSALAVGTATSNKSFIGTYNDSATFAINRNPATGTTVNASQSIAQIFMETGNATSDIQFFTGNANGWYGERMRIDKDGKVGIATSVPGAKLDVSGDVAVNSSYEGISTYVNSSTAYTIPDTSLNIRRITLTANTTITLPAFTSPSAKVFTITIFLKQDATGSRTVTFAGNASDTIKWDTGTAPTISTTANKISIIQLTKPSDETVWYGSMAWREN